MVFLESHADERRYSTQKENENRLRIHVFPVIGDMLIRDVDQSSVLKVLEPIWKTKTVTASVLRNRIENIIDWVEARGYRSGENPARWKCRLRIYP